MSRPDEVCGQGGRPPDYMPHLFGNDFFVTQPVLHRTHWAGTSENVRRLRDGVTRVQALGGKDAEIARRNLVSARGGVKPGDEFGRAADVQSALGDRAHMWLGDVVSVNFDRIEARKVRGKNAAQRATTHD